MAALAAFSLGLNRSRRDRALLLGMATLAAMLYAALFFLLFTLIARYGTLMAYYAFHSSLHRGFPGIMTGEAVFLFVFGCTGFAVWRARSRRLRSSQPRKRTYPLGLNL